VNAMLVAISIWSLVAIPQPQIEDLDPGYWERTQLPEIGIATYYAPGKMDWVWGYRQRLGQVPDCPECVGAVALLRAGDIGRKIWLQPPNGELTGPFLVVDCAHTEDVGPLLERNWVVDISYELGQLWGMVRPLDNVVVWADPAEEEAGRASSGIWHYVDPKDVMITEPTPTSAVGSIEVSTWPTRMPLPLVPVSTPGPTAGPVVSQASGLPLVTTPTPQGGPMPATPLPVDTPTLEVMVAEAVAANAVAAEAIAERDMDAVPSQSAPSDIALGRPGGELLMTPTEAHGWAEGDHPAAATALTPARTPRATSAPILMPEQVHLPSSPSQAEVSAFARLWQALMDLVKR
jgi:hypothetical protein